MHKIAYHTKVCYYLMFNPLLFVRPTEVILYGTEIMSSPSAIESAALKKLGKMVDNRGKYVRIQS